MSGCSNETPNTPKPKRTDASSKAAGMSDQQILEIAIRKATNRGYKDEPNYTMAWSYRNNNWVLPDKSYYAFIFDHHFAKALWGEARVDDDGILFRDEHDMIIPSKTKLSTVHRGWRYHLQQMVIAEDPIQYLGENI
jgi:hypothetical protein